MLIIWKKYKLERVRNNIAKKKKGNENYFRDVGSRRAEKVDQRFNKEQNHRDETKSKSNIYRTVTKEQNQRRLDDSNYSSGFSMSTHDVKEYTNSAKSIVPFESQSCQSTIVKSKIIKFMLEERMTVKIHIPFHSNAAD